MVPEQGLSPRLALVGLLLPKSRFDTLGFVALLNVRDLGTDPHAEDMIGVIAPGVVDAGNPYLRWLFGSSAAERVSRWMRRPTSELAVRRVTIHEQDGEVAGGFLGMAGETVRRCRLADAVALVGETEAPQASAARARIAGSARLFPRPANEDFYLSKLWVLPPLRGRGLGRSLMETFLERARHEGFERCRLEVSASNEPAMRLYQSLSFDVINEAAIPGTEVRYLWMTARC